MSLILTIEKTPMKLPNVVFVTDDQALQNSISLVKSAEFVVWLVLDSENLYKSLLRRSVDVLVIDVDIPNFDVLQAIHYLFELLHVPIITISSTQSVISEAELLHAGADRNLIKPVVINDLFANIRAIIRREAPKQPMIFDANAWRLDCHRWLLSSPGGTGLELSSREVVVIKALMEAQGLPLSKTELTQRLFGFDESKPVGSIDMLICRLRKKARNVLAQELPIKNARLNGYVFASPGMLV